MQLDAFAELWRWSIEHPESSIRQIMIDDFHNDKTDDQIWWKGYMPETRNFLVHWNAVDVISC